MIIKIIVENDEGEVLGMRQTALWDVAEQNFGSLQKRYQNKNV